MLVWGEKNGAASAKHMQARVPLHCIRQPPAGGFSAALQGGGEVREGEELGGHGFTLSNVSAHTQGLASQALGPLMVFQRYANEPIQFPLVPGR